MTRLSGKIAAITGAARGIGAAIARRFHDQGAMVWITDIRGDEAQALAQELGPRAFSFTLDVANEAHWQTFSEQLMAGHGRLDVIVNNAGITGFEGAFVPHDPEHAALDDWRAVHRVNTDGTFLGCRMALRLMRSTTTGSIINISSRSGLVGIPGAAAYAASKAAIRNHTKTVALYCAEQGWTVRCNSIHPEAILTPMWEPMLGDGPDRADRMAAFVKDTPLQRFGTADEVAALAAFLASDDSAYITGAEFNIDGGLLAGSAAIPARK
jgi:NAD(P)-dependent dehydrogenase (short-subunit alcohol dehydrogenase family)